MRPDYVKLYSMKRWRAIRKQRLALDPLCKICLEHAKATPATVVDHIVPHKGDLRLFYQFSNTQSLCKRCHDADKQRFEKSGRRLGNRADGSPIDPAHHWNTER